jgi:glycosyltransferase involved in cell wall biosynthesis
MLSAIVITHNEEARIKKCLASLSFADEIIVVDSYSTDNTADLARQMGAQVFQNKWQGFGHQKNLAASKASGDWLLYIDADEEVSLPLSKKIRSIVNNRSSHNFYWLTIITVFLNKPLRHLYGHNLRLFKKNAGCWNDSSVHEQVITNEGHLIKLKDNKSGLIKTPLLHFSHQTITSYLNKMHHYTSLDAEQMRSTGKHRSGKKFRPSALLPLKLSFKQLIKLLFYKRGFLDGLPGTIWCLLSSYYEYEMAKKYLFLLKTKP